MPVRRFHYIENVSEPTAVTVAVVAVHDLSSSEPHP